jgi:transposase-like protein
MTGTQTQGIDRNIDAASRFLDRVRELSPAERERIARDTFGTSAHTSAMMMVADEVSALKNKDRQGRVSSFLVDLERRVDGMGLQPELGDLVKAAARGLLVQGAPGLDRATRQLYSPFEQVVPLPSASE